MIRKLFKFTFFIIFLGTLGIISFIGLVYIGAFGPIANNKELTEIKQAQASVVYSADDKIIGRFFHTNRTNVAYKKLPQHLINALIATEDARFYEHNGIDKIAMLRVLFKTILLGNASSGGGSTISQQLAKNLFSRKDFGILSMPVNKTKEAILANRLESIYTKQEILSLYFNTVPFGEGVYGIESAAQRYFSVPVNKLTLEQSAILVGMLKANSYYNPRQHPDHAFKRRNTVLFQMKKAGFLSDDEYLEKSKDSVYIQYQNLVIENPNGYFLKQVKNNAEEILKDFEKEDGSNWQIENDGLIIETTLVSSLQKNALEARKTHLIKLQKAMDTYWNILKHKQNIQNIISKEWQQTRTYKRLKNAGISEKSIKDNSKIKQKRLVFNWEDKNNNYSQLDSISHYLKMINAAIYGVNTHSGAVQIYVGGNNFEFLPYNLITSERQVASTFKPIIYTAALENGQQPCDWINNEVKTYTDYDDWKPENYDHSDGGYYTMVGALAKSVNVPTVATYFDVGADKLQKTANALGLDKELKRVPSTALGTTNYSLQNIVHAYIPFATRGYRVAPYYITAIKDNKGNIIYQHQENTDKKEPVLDVKTMETMQLLLKGVVDKGTAVRLKSQYGAKGDWGGKTGTSQDYSDSWFIGFNSNIIIGTWVGCKYPTIHLPSRIGGGSVAALPIVGQIIGKNYEDKNIQKDLSAGFPKFDEKILSSCDCEFFREENTFEKIFDLFDKKKKKKGNFFTRLFGGKKEEDKDSIE
ncbi:transglycosylase domain-containing protein [Wenyingzhuangia sp. IMCC45467]